MQKVKRKKSKPQKVKKIKVKWQKDEKEKSQKEKVKTAKSQRDKGQMTESQKGKSQKQKVKTAKSQRDKGQMAESRKWKKSNGTPTRSVLCDRLVRTDLFPGSNIARPLPPSPFPRAALPLLTTRTKIRSSSAELNTEQWATGGGGRGRVIVSSAVGRMRLIN